MALTTKPEIDERPTPSCQFTRSWEEVTDDNAPDVIEGARSGSESAWRTIATHYAPALEGFAASKGSGDPSGIASTCLLELARSIGTFRGTDKRSLDAYVYRTARNRIIDEFRKQRVETVSLLEEPQLIDFVASDLETTIVARDWVADALGTLTTEQRRVIELRILEDRSVAETAALLNKHPGTVSVLQHRAIKALRVVLAAAAVLALFFGLRSATRGPVDLVDSTPASQPDGGIGDGQGGTDNRDSGESSDNHLERRSDSEQSSSTNSQSVDVDDSADEITGSNEVTGLAPDAREDDAENDPESDTAATDESADSPDGPVGANVDDGNTESSQGSQSSAATSDAAVPESSSTLESNSDGGPAGQTVSDTTTSEPVPTTEEATPVPIQEPVESEGPASPSDPVDTAEPETVAPVVDPAPTPETPIYVRRPTGCEVQITGFGTQGVEIHEPSQVFADSYALLDLYGQVVIEVSNPEQVEGDEIEFESIPQGFDSSKIYSVSAVENGTLSSPRTCSRFG